MPTFIREFLEHGPATSKEIQEATGQSQTTVASKLRSIGNDIVKLRKGRTVKYALTRNAFGSDNNIPIVIVDAYGNTVVVAWLRPLAPEGFLVEPDTGMPSMFLGANGDGLYDDLPFFLWDLCPQGYIGRQIAKELSEQSDFFPSDPKRWSANHVGRFLLSNGDDLPGNVKFGPHSFDRVRRRPERTTVSDYPRLANSIIEGEPPGSSAGGEQAKFTTYNSELSSHVIVKFASNEDSNPVARRWRDILITEHIANQVFHDSGIPAAETRLLEIEGRTFLESIRFDRSGEFGRMAMISLESIDNEFTTIGSSWPKVMKALRQKNLISWQHVYDVLLYWLFGKLINNTDMHLGNLSFAVEGDFFRLLPVYDMCSMGFRPKSSGEVPPFEFECPSISKTDVGLTSDHFIKMLARAKALAANFWDHVADHESISDEFKEYLLAGNPIDSMKY